MGSRHNSRKKRQPKEPKTSNNYLFAVDERVLCYEPDQNKARVLYDSKVLAVVDKSNNGKPKVEYKIHFSGWNSTWDRFVEEKFVLKNTDANRALQKKLKAEADALLNTHVKKKKRKKTLTEIVKDATKGNEGQSPTSKTKTDEASNANSSSDESEAEAESSGDEDNPIPKIIINRPLQQVLQWDCFNITKRNLLVRVPAYVSVDCVFEGYVKHYGFKELTKLLQQRESYVRGDNVFPLSPLLLEALTPTNSGGKYGSAKPTLSNSIEPWLEEVNRIYRKVSQAQEIVSGLKTIFDYKIYYLLLYEVENEYFLASTKLRPIVPEINCIEIIPKIPPILQPPQEHSSNEQPGPSRLAGDKVEINAKVSETTTIRPKADLLSTRSHSEKNSEKLAQDAAQFQAKVQKFVSELDKWVFMPLDYYTAPEADPTALYGLIHLLRFISKLPDVLNRMHLSRRILRIIARHVNQLLGYIEECHRFSTREMFVAKPTPSFVEDRIKINASKTNKKQSAPVIVEGECSKSQYSTKSHRLHTNTVSHNASVIEIDLTNTGETLEEHQLTVGLNSSKNAAESEEIGEESGKTPSTNDQEQPSTSKSLSNAPPDDIRVVRVVENPKKKPEPATQAATATDPPPESKKQAPEPTETPKPPPPPPHRHVRESAANAAFKNAHIFASQQNFFSRSSLSSSVSKRVAKARQARKRPCPSGDVVGPPSKKRTRTCSKSTPDNGPRSTPGKADNSSPSCHTTKEIKETDKSLTKNSRRISPDRVSGAHLSTPVPASKVKRNSGSVDSKSRSNVRRESNEKEKRASSSNRSLSPRTTKPTNLFKESVTKSSPHKSSSQTPNTIRLRSKSGERQLRSKGSLINALSLPVQVNHRSPSKSFSERSPARRESLNSTNKESQNPSSPTSCKQNEPSRNLRSRR